MQSRAVTKPNILLTNAGAARGARSLAKLFNGKTMQKNVPRRSVHVCKA
jgi:hypothetical protein